MKVLHVSTGHTWRGGERQALLLMRGLAEGGVQQSLVAPRGSPLAERAADAGFRVHAMSIRNEGDVAALGRITAILRRGGHDLLHLHTSQAHGLGAAAARLVGSRRPGVVVTRRVEHSIYRHSFLNLDRLKYAPGADRVLCVSERVRDVLRADGLSAGMLVVVPDGVDLDALRRVGATREATRAGLGIPGDACVVGTVGHLDEAKGHHHLLEAFAHLRVERRDAHLLFVGEGPARRHLERQAGEQGLARNVTFAGFRDDVPDLLRAMDVFAFPSLGEGLGSSVLEAMAVGTPIVATRVGGIPEALRDGVDGLLVAAGDPLALAGAVRRILANPARARERAASAADRVAQRYGVERMVDATRAAYEAVLASRARRRPLRRPGPP